MNEREVRERRYRLECECGRAGATACNEAAKAQEFEERASALREHARVASKQLKDLAAYQDGLAAEHRDAERSARDRYDALSAELREFNRTVGMSPEERIAELEAKLRDVQAAVKG